MEPQPRPKPKSGQGEQKLPARERIVNAAAVLFREQGYAAVSLRQIASEACVTTGSVYHHFASKDDAVLAVMNGAHNIILTEVSGAVGFLGHRATALQKLVAAVDAHIDSLFGENSLPAATIRIFHQVPKPVRIATLPSRHAYERYWVSLLEECRANDLIEADRDLTVLVPLIFGAMNWLLEWVDVERHSLRGVKDEVVRLLVMNSCEKSA